MSQMFEVMATISPERTTDEWLALMKTANVPAMRVNRIDELLENSQLKASGLLRERVHPTEGAYVEVAMPVRFSARAPVESSHPSNVGEHSVEVARELGVEIAARTSAI